MILTHRNAMAFVEWGVALFRVTRADRLSTTPRFISISRCSILCGIGAGAGSTRCRKRCAVPESARAVDRRQEITIWYSVPSALVRMLLHGRFVGFSFRRYGICSSPARSFR